MTTVSYPDHVELAAIHAAVCRARRAGLVCSTCSELAERAVRAARSVVESEAA
jgi:hypothetical protein